MERTAPTPASTAHCSVQPQVADLRHPPGEGRDVEHELGLHELRARRDLLAQPVGPELHRRGERVLHRAQEAVRRRVELAPGQQDVLVAHGTQGPQQLHAVQVEHRLGPRVVAELRVITGHDQDVADAERRRAEQVGLQRDAVTVPAGHLHDRLEPGLEDGEAAGPAGQAHVGALVVGDVDRVHPVFEASGGFGDLRRAGPAGRADLGGHREAARGQALAQAHRRAPCLLGPQVLVAALPVVQPRALAPAPVIDRTVQQAQVTGPVCGGRAIVSVDPDAAAVRVHLARAVRAHSPARPVAQFLRAAHRAHVPGDGQRTLAAHPAAERFVLGLALRAGEQRAGRALSLDPGREPAVAGVRPQDPLQPVGHAGAQARMDGNW